LSLPFVCELVPAAAGCARGPGRRVAAARATVRSVRGSTLRMEGGSLRFAGRQRLLYPARSAQTTQELVELLLLDLMKVTARQGVEQVG
jgi:hypothetical protein